MQPKSILFFCLMLSLPVFAQFKVVESSGKQPTWVNGMKDGYIIGTGTALTIDEAKEEAFLKVKAQIVAAVADQVKSSSMLLTEEVTADNISSMYEKFSSVTTTQTAKRDFLHGVSPSKVEGYYWEQLQEKKTKQVKCNYHILYPFTTFDLMELVDEFKAKDAELTKEMQKSLDLLEKFTSIEEIKEAVSQLQKLLSIFMDERKVKCETGIEKGKSLLQSVYIVDRGSVLGKVKYSLQIGDRQVSTAMRPKMKTNCAQITDKSLGNMVVSVAYDYNECYNEPGNSITVSYRIGNLDIAKDFVFDVSAAKVKISVNGSIRLKGTQLPITLVSSHHTAITVPNVLLHFADGSSATLELNKRISGTGRQDIIASLPNALAVSDQKMQELSGYIYYQNDKTGETQSLRMYKQAVKIEE